MYNLQPYLYYRLPSLFFLYQYKNFLQFKIQIQTKEL